MPFHWPPAILGAALVAGLALAFGGVSPANACTTALPPLPVAAYRAASPVVLGTVESASPMHISVRVEVAYRGEVGERFTLTSRRALDWCAFPWGVPAVGSRVLLAVVDPTDWQWPGSAVWMIDPAGRIVSPPEAPWTGASAPTTVAEALATMGISGREATVPPTSTAPPAPTGGRGRDALFVFLLGVGALAGASRWVVGRLSKGP